MRATAIVPVKRFGAAKQRLSDVLAPEQRAALAAAMLSDVLAALADARSIERVLVVSGEPRVAALLAGGPAELLDDPADAGHSQATLLGVAAALARNASCVALLPGDCPLLEAAELDAALEELTERTVAVIPDRHGSGTNGLLLHPPDLIEPAFGPGSRERHLQLARAAGAQAVVAELPSLELDLDTGGDLGELRALVAAGALAGSATAPAVEALAPVAGGSR